MGQIMAKRAGTDSEKILPGLVILSTQEAEVGGFKVHSLPGLHRAHGLGSRPICISQLDCLTIKKEFEGVIQ